MLKLNSTGSDVKELQGYLKTIGYSYVSVTGTFDSNTNRAVKDIQTKNKLDVDGVVGEGTWAAIINTYVNTVLKQMGREEYPEQNFDDEHVPNVGNGNSGNNTGSGSNTNTGSNSNTNTGSNTGSSAPAVPVISVSGRSMVYNGCTGGDVKALQQLLNRLGYGLVEDGIFGSGTDAAVRSFQKKYGLTVDGYVGPASWKKLGEVANPKVNTGSSSGSGSTSGSNTGSSNNSGSGSSTNTNTTKPVGTSISVTGRSMVYYGSTGSDVKALQQLLNILGYGLATDGIFGSGTNSAVRSFQSKQKLVVDGYVGSATWAALGKACGSGSTAGSTSSSTGSSSSNAGSSNISTSGRPTVGYGDSGSNVKALQQLLNKYGYGLAEDGIFGSGTYSAVQRFQASKGLVADGIVGPLTWAKL